MLIVLQGGFPVAVLLYSVIGSFICDVCFVIVLVLISPFLVPLEGYAS